MLDKIETVRLNNYADQCFFFPEGVKKTERIRKGIKERFSSRRMFPVFYKRVAVEYLIASEGCHNDPSLDPFYVRLSKPACVLENLVREPIFMENKRRTSTGPSGQD